MPNASPPWTIAAIAVGALMMTGTGASGADRPLRDALEREGCTLERILRTERHPEWTLYDIACRGPARVLRIACTGGSCTRVAAKPEDER